MKTTTAKNFFELLKMNGMADDSMHLMMIERKLAEGLEVAVKFYAQYLSNVEVKKVTASEVTALVKKGAKVWTTEGLIVNSKMNVPSLNGILLLNANIEKMVKTSVIVLK